MTNDDLFNEVLHDMKEIGRELAILYDTIIDMLAALDETPPNVEKAASIAQASLGKLKANLQSRR